MKNIKHYRTGEQRKTTARQKEPQREDPPTAEDEALLQRIYHFKNAQIILSIEKEREKEQTVSSYENTQQPSLQPLHSATCS